jgi:hypothetical protein
LFAAIILFTQFAAIAKENAMIDLPLKDMSREHKPEWKTVDYRGKQIHVFAAPRARPSEELDSHGQQWDFKIKITEGGAGPTATPLASAASDPAVFYATQAVTEQLAFVKGREMVDGVDGVGGVGASMPA